MANVRVSFEKVTEEHLALQQMARELRHFLKKPQPEIPGEDSHIWAGDLAERLVRLHRKAYFHIREEEQSGLLEEIAEKLPQAERTVDALRKEHDQLLGEMRAIVAATMICAEDKLPSEPDLRGRTLKLLNRLDHHRIKETDLFMRVHWEDLGVVCG